MTGADGRLLRRQIRRKSLRQCSARRRRKQHSRLHGRKPPSTQGRRARRRRLWSEGWARQRRIETLSRQRSADFAVSSPPQIWPPSERLRARPRRRLPPEPLRKRMRPLRRKLGPRRRLRGWKVHSLVLWCSQRPKSPPRQRAFASRRMPRRRRRRQCAKRRRWPGRRRAAVAPPRRWLRRRRSETRHWRLRRPRTLRGLRRLTRARKWRRRARGVGRAAQLPSARLST
mmetsp:Transcript_49107/g.162580  ORF Transcript_49107/g.162580 Transcript_49107/m.162580 type:complete len:229 (-) Transcript_49107:478-1164(-)